MESIVFTVTHCIRLNWATVTTAQAVDALTHVVGTDLLLRYGIDTTQSSQDTLEFESSRHAVFAALALSNDSRFTLELVSKDSSF